MLAAIKPLSEAAERTTGPDTYVQPCKCRKCQARFHPKENQSSLLCVRCLADKSPVATGSCLHGVSLLDRCSTCMGLYGSPHMRLKAPAQKSTVKKITLTRMKPVR